MKGNISLGDFIKKVKSELVAAQDKGGTAFFQLREVELEVSFVLDAKANTEGQLLVVKLGGETKATQTHKVVMKFLPLAQSAPGLGLPAYSDGPGLPSTVGLAPVTPSSPTVDIDARKTTARGSP